MRYYNVAAGSNATPSVLADSITNLTAATSWTITAKANLNFASASGNSINFAAVGGGSIAFTTGGGDDWEINAAGLLRAATATNRVQAAGFNHTGVTIATLPTPSAGMTAYVTDGAAGLAWGATVTGGGGGDTTKYLVWYNGTNWTVVGK